MHPGSPAPGQSPPTPDPFRPLIVLGLSAVLGIGANVLQYLSVLELPRATVYVLFLCIFGLVLSAMQVERHVRWRRLRVQSPSPYVPRPSRSYGYGGALCFAAALVIAVTSWPPNAVSVLRALLRFVAGLSGLEATATVIAISALTVSMAVIPIGSLWRRPTIAVSLGLVVAALYISLTPPGPPGATRPSTADEPALRRSGPSLVVDPGVVTSGNMAAVSGTGFEPHTGVTFRFETSDGISWPTTGFAAADADGSFTAQLVADMPVCGLSGGILAFDGQSADMTRDADGYVPLPVAGTPVIVGCP